MNEENKDEQQSKIDEMFEKSVVFHGHQCPGLAIGVRAAAEAQRRLGVERSGDEEIVCVTENDACGVDGIQVILGCTAGKGNLRFRLTGKHAYTFYNRTTQRAIRFVLKDLPKMASREEKQKYILNAPFDQVFQVTPPSRGMPPEASLYPSVNCEVCGESTAEPFIRLREGKKLCGDCLRNEVQKAAGGIKNITKEKVVTAVKKSGEVHGNRTN